MAHLSDAQWASFQHEGYVNLGRVLDDAELYALQKRIDEIMLGKADLDYDTLLMQLDSETGRYEELGEQTRGFKGATLEYRKIQDLENDNLFREYMQRPIFREICTRVYGPQTRIACFRAMFMNKPAGKGTLLPWHQDRWQALDRDPLVTVWTALDPATRANGCVQILPGTHMYLINPAHHSGFLEPHQVNEHCPDDAVAYLQLEAGEAVLLHNWLLHRSDVNKSDRPRRAFSVCYMDGRTVDHMGRRYPLAF